MAGHEDSHETGKMLARDCPNRLDNLALSLHLTDKYLLNLLRVLRAGLGVLVLVAFLQPLSVSAVPIALFQDWERPAVVNGDRLRTSATFDDSGVAATGSSAILLDRFNVIRFINDVAQSAETARFTDPPSLLVEGNIFALFVDGAFRGLNGVNQGGGAHIAMEDFTTGGILTTTNIFGSQGDVGTIFRNVGGGNSIPYKLVASEFVNLTAISEPATLPIMLTTVALFGVFVARRRRGV